MFQTGTDVSCSSRRGLAALMLGASLALSGCAAPRIAEEPWVYALSRGFYGECGSGGDFLASSLGDACSQEAAVATLVVFALPFALDTVLLPITVPHDLLAR